MAIVLTVYSNPQPPTPPPKVFDQVGNSSLYVCSVGVTVPYLAPGILGSFRGM